MPQILDDFVQPGRLAGGDEALAPSDGIRREVLRSRHDTSEIAHSGGSDADGGVDGWSEAVTVRTTNASELGIRIEWWSQRVSAFAYRGQWSAEKASDADFDIADEPWVMGALVLPPVGKDSSLNEILGEASLGESVQQGLEGTAGVGVGGGRGLLRQ